jgi:hypothetical protein
MHFQIKNWNILQNSSILNSDGNYATSTFARNNSQARFHFKKLIGGSLRLENNKEKLVSTNQLSALSQRFTEYGAFCWSWR